MAPQCSSDHTENMEVDEHCDGCDRRHRASDLTPIADGSIKVCRECYSAATAMLSTRSRPAISEQEPAAPRQFSAAEGPAVSPYQNPQLALPGLSGASGRSGPPSETKSFARGS